MYRVLSEFKVAAFSRNIINIYLVALFQLFLGKLSRGNLFQVGGIMMPPGQVLLNNVTQSYYGNARMINCIEKCGDISTCHSINWYRDLGLCQLNDDTHLSYPEGITPNSTGDYMIYGVYPMVICSNKMCTQPTFCVMEEDGINFRCKDNCSAALGMEDGRIKDSQLSASSSYRDNLGPQRARLYSNVPDGSWAARHYVAGQYLQIDLLSPHVITHVATQGREYQYQLWVTKYYLKYEYRDVIWKSYRYGGIVKEFEGNVDKNSVVTHKLPAPIKTNGIRFVALKWHNGIALRVELYGCTAH